MKFFDIISIFVAQLSTDFISLLPTFEIHFKRFVRKYSHNFMGYTFQLIAAHPNIEFVKFVDNYLQHFGTQWMCQSAGVFVVRESHQSTGRILEQVLQVLEGNRVKKKFWFSCLPLTQTK
jgi:hypothetical protein